MSIKTTHPVVRASLGIAALVLIAIFANWLVSLTPIGNHGKDFTENKIHTLSDGTRSILAELISPVTIRYYATRNTTYMPEEVKLHMRRVDDLLKEYVNLSKGKLRVETLDPEPDTDAEDSANLDGISGQRFEDENLFFGMANIMPRPQSQHPLPRPQRRDDAGIPSLPQYRRSQRPGETRNRPDVRL